MIVAARNEASTIERCIRAIAEQDYDRFELIVADDRSQDDTALLAAKTGALLSQFKLIRIHAGDSLMAPKKNALNEAIKVAGGEILLFTDADCRPPSTWISSMVAHFRDEVGLVVGYSPVDPQGGLLDRFLSLDSLALAGMAASGSALGLTMTATGRSLAYRRQVFEEVGGFSRIAQFVSGDDDLFLGLVQKTSWKTAYCMDSAAAVPTLPPEKFSTFVHQKIRQASKSRNYSPKIIAILTTIYVFNAVLLSYVPARAWMEHSIMFLMPWGVKVTADLLFLIVAGFRLGRIRFLLSYPLVALVHPFYVVVFGAWGRFGTFEWKAQKTEVRL